MVKYISDKDAVLLRRTSIITSANPFDIAAE